MTKTEVYNHVVEDIREEVEKDLSQDYPKIREIIETRAMFSISCFLQDLWTEMSVFDRQKLMSEISKEVEKYFLCQKESKKF